jgi:hypothetical protein
MYDDQFVAIDDQQISHERIVEPLSSRISREKNMQYLIAIAE